MPKSTYNPKYYFHRKVKKADFCLELEKCTKTILVTRDQVDAARTNKYVGILQNEYSYGVQITNPLWK
jgi:hypothetical protein